MQVWPEHIGVLNLFDAVRTQWRVGMAGPTGLDYPAVLATLDRLFSKLSEERRNEMFLDLQVMEREALDVMAKASKKQTYSP